MDTAARCKGTGNGSIVARQPSYGSGWRVDLTVGPYWLLAGGTQGGLNFPTHVLPRCLPTPTEEADGNGYGAIAGQGGPSRPPPTRQSKR